MRIGGLSLISGTEHIPLVGYMFFCVDGLSVFLPKQVDL